MLNIYEESCIYGSTNSVAYGIYARLVGIVRDDGTI